MKIGLQIPDYTWGNSQALSPTLLRIARVAEEAGFELIGVPDHLWQVSPWVGPVEHEMLECYTTLAFLAGNTSRINLMAMVTGAHFRHPSLLAKIVTTLDVLSGGRAWLGIGAGYYQEEARGLGIDLPPVAERFERLEEVVQICLRMWEGERKTLRLVARYADACALFPTPELPHKLDVLRAHCQAEGRDYDDVRKTCGWNFDLGEDGSNIAGTIEQLRRLAGMGIEVVLGPVKGVEEIEPLQAMGRDVIPAVADI
jgi:alkanesulfonate monooxygenase SsuD/methylene tetrahydromethanopterin reductase-like flavin-dependent oxidoreductase (luciferase family)